MVGVVSDPQLDYETFRADPGLYGEIYSPDITDGMTRWQVFLWDCGRFWRWVLRAS